jgi:hypothetical protein
MKWRASSAWNAALNAAFERSLKHSLERSLIRSPKCGLKTQPETRPETQGKRNLKLDRHEIFLAHIAQRAAPAAWDIAESGSGCYAVFRHAIFFVVDPATNQTNPAFIF